MRKIRVIIIVIIRKGIALNFLLIAPQVSIEACDKKPVRPLRCVAEKLFFLQKSSIFIEQPIKQWLFVGTFFDNAF
jgi:hypothetical protein